MASNSKRDPVSRWPYFFLLTAIESAGFLIALLRVPSESGLSLARTLMLIPLMVAVGLSLWAVFNPQNAVRSLTPRLISRLIPASALIALTLAIGLFLLRYADPERLLVYYERAWPLLVFLIIFSLQASLWLIALQNGIHPESLASKKQILRPALIAFGILLFTFLLIAVTKLGITPDPAYWGEPGVPVIGWQFAIILLLGACSLLFIRHLPPRLSQFLLPFSIYIFAVVLWLSVPVEVLRNSFYVSIDPPAFQPFPYSDAGYYDWMAHSLLIGHPYQGDIPTRPLFIVFLAFLHTLFGENYKLIIAGQTVLLALIPVVLYLLGKRIHSRAAGVTAALFFIFREFTSLLVSSDTRVSNTKTLLVDLPTLLLVSLSCLFALRWLEKRDFKSAFIAGGTFGALLLLRTQSMLILPVMLLAALLVFGLRNRQFVLQSIFVILGLAFTVTPWLTHNYLQTGQFTFDAPFQYKVIASQYAYTGNLDLQNYDFEGKGLGQVLIEFAIKDPKFVFGFIANHFLAGEVDGLLALPLVKPYNGLFAPLNLYWTSWDGSLEWYNVLLLLFYLAMIALGLGAAWKRLRWAGLLPLGFNLAYVLATAIGRFSGWRYDLPADWIPYFYFAIGFIELTTCAVSVFGGKVQEDEAESFPPGGFHFSKLIPYAVLFAFIGALPWLAKGIAAPRYADQSPAALIAQTASIRNAPSMDEIIIFASQPDAVFQEGRLLYPRFYIRNEGASSKNPWPAYAARPYPRLGFLLLNQTLAHAVFPTKGGIVDAPQASDAIVLACNRGDYLEVRLLAFPELKTIYLSAPLTDPCK